MLLELFKFITENPDTSQRLLEDLRPRETKQRVALESLVF